MRDDVIFSQSGHKCPVILCPVIPHPHCTSSAPLNFDNLDHDSIWGVSPAGECFFKPTVDAAFQHVPGLKMKMIATGLLGAFGVNQEGFLFYRSGTNGKTSMGTGWQP